MRLHPRLKEIGLAADASGLRAYLVGGAVRDLLKGVRVLDWDIVVEGDPKKLVHRLARRWSGSVKEHPKFGTYVLTLPNGHHIDFATARREKYPKPGSLPVVSPSTLADDLYRRDFTLNALALSLGAKDFGRVIDLYGGLRDLRKKELNLLHARSFRDDPTRLLRGARFAARGYRPGKRTVRFARRDKGYLRRVSPARIREELLAILSERCPEKALNLLRAWGALDRLIPGLKKKFSPGELSRLRTLPERLSHIISCYPEKERTRLMRELHLPRAFKAAVRNVLDRQKQRPVLTGSDLIAMGYVPGPVFGKILSWLAAHPQFTRAQARRAVFDKYPQKI